MNLIKKLGILATVAIGSYQMQAQNTDYNLKRVDPTSINEVRADINYDGHEDIIATGIVGEDRAYTYLIEGKSDGKFKSPKFLFSYPTVETKISDIEVNGNEISVIGISPWDERTAYTGNVINGKVKNLEADNLSGTGWLYE